MGLKTIFTAPRKVPTPAGDQVQLHNDFESLLQAEDVPYEVRQRLRTVDAAVKAAFIDVSSPAAAVSARPTSPRKHGRTQSRSSLFLSPSKKGKVVAAAAGAVDIELQFDEPAQFIRYLATRSPEKVRIDLVHKLRIMLRTQRKTWLATFLDLSGPQVLYVQLQNIIGIEWREEHEDVLMSELLGCIQSICTASTGADMLQIDNLRSLVTLLLSDKQPSDYRCRGQIMNLLQLYLTSTMWKPGLEHVRSLQVLSCLTDPVRPLSERPLEMLEAAHTPRPYKKWMAELDRPVRDCFWIFLHDDNQVPVLQPGECDDMIRRAPIVPAGYVGGVEWTAVEYICTHLSLINTILAHLPLDERTSLRRHLKTSHFEKICGMQLRRASMRYYGYLHEELTIWASRAAADGWKVSTVTTGTRDDAAAARSKRKEKSTALQGHARSHSHFLPKLKF